MRAGNITCNELSRHSPPVPVGAGKGGFLFVGRSFKG
nr:MAG TPA: hypothetical protein [Caudoviricetes sp.]